MSISSLDGFVISNACSTLAKVKCNNTSVEKIPGQILLPVSNGINSNWFHLRSVSL